MSFPITRPTLLSRMRKGDESAWSEFVRAYTDAAIAFLRSLGLSEEDAKDLWQEVLLKMPLGEGVLHTYRADKGRFRSWLMRAVKRRVIDWWRETKAKKRGGGSVIVSGDEPLSPDEPDGPTRFDQLEDESTEHFAATYVAFEKRLDDSLRDYPYESQKRAFLEWFWKDKDETDEEIAARHDLNLGQLRHIRKKVLAHLQKRWKNEPGL
jgi:RNA polymerase sigma factor (sigma-70 family)